MSSDPIYTIGYGNRSIGEFIELLKRYGIQYLVDIRSQPYSRYNSDFSKDALERHLTKKQENLKDRCYLQISGWYL